MLRLLSSNGETIQELSRLKQTTNKRSVGFSTLLHSNLLLGEKAGESRKVFTLLNYCKVFLSLQSATASGAGETAIGEYDLTPDMIAKIRSERESLAGSLLQTAAAARDELQKCVLAHAEERSEQR